jgi:lysophospholipase L1-like esterase
MESSEKQEKTRTKLLVVGIATLILLSGFMVFLLENFGNRIFQVSVTRVACVGDSITEGSGYTKDLRNMLNSNFSIGNFGVGKSAVLLTSDKPYMNQFAFQWAKEFRPNIIIIMLGTNDATPGNYQHIGGFVDDYRKLIDEFQNLESKPKIWLVKPPPIVNNALGPVNVNLVKGVIPRIEQVAHDLGLPIIDVYSAFGNHTDYFLPDGLHPNSEGAEVIASQVYGAISVAYPAFEVNVELAPIDASLP